MSIYSEIKAQEAIKQKREVENNALQFEISALEEKKKKLESELMNQYGFLLTASAHFQKMKFWSMPCWQTMP
ncbi:MAG: hypothetical protein AB9834_05660 [Lentimicrobium sp.]